MTTPSKQVIERAEEKGWTHLLGPYFQKREPGGTIDPKTAYYEYDPDTETMVPTSKEDFEDWVSNMQVEPMEPTKTEPVEIVTPTDAKLALAIELADERQIIEEIEGRVIDNYVYSFKLGNREVIGLSYSGVKWVAREMAKRGEPIDIEELTKEEDETHWTVTAKAVNRKTEEHRFGVARQAKEMTLKDGSTKPDDYALTKAVSKAQRNALRSFEPEEIVVEMVREWREKREERERF